MRVLVVEDHAETRRLLERALEEAGHDVVAAGSLAAARLKIAEGTCAAAIIDWMLPDGEGLALCRSLRGAARETAILMLTARGDVHDRVRALDAGADDYLRKPFAVAELLARIRALLRRGPRLEEERLWLGDVEVLLAQRRVLRRGASVPLTEREFAILEMLLTRRGAPVSRSDLLDVIWGDHGEGAEASLEVLMGRLRRKLTIPGHEPVIRTHRGLGYSVEITRDPAP
jgi:DNA-binding response OmpR family regulator